MKKTYIENYFKNIAGLHRAGLVKLTREWTKAIQDAKTETDANIYRELRAASITAYNLIVYCDLCNALFTRTRKGYKLEFVQDDTKYFYSVLALDNFINYNLDNIPLATIAEYYSSLGA